MEEYHFLLSQFVDSSPTLFLSSKLASATFECAKYCLSSAQDEPTISAILKYILDLFDLVKPNREVSHITLISLISNVMIAHDSKMDCILIE